MAHFLVSDLRGRTGVSSWYDLLVVDYTEVLYGAGGLDPGWVDVDNTKRTNPEMLPGRSWVLYRGQQELRGVNLYKIGVDEDLTTSEE